jgi:TatD DNase family protein
MDSEKSQSNDKEQSRHSVIDTHCHIDLYPNPLAVAQRCEKAGVSTLAMTNLPSHFGQGIHHLKGFKHIRLALGLHPLYADRHRKEYALFDKYFGQTSYIGEVGLDFSREGVATKEKQLESFGFVLGRVQGKKKLLSLHSRGAENVTLEMLVHHNINLAIFHWYTGSVTVLQEAANRGYYFSINPAMLRSEKARSLILKMPRDLLLTETDGPFVQCNNRIVEPTDVVLIIQHLAKVWDVSIEEAQNQIRQNFKRLVNKLR